MIHPQKNYYNFLKKKEEEEKSKSNRTHSVKPWRTHLESQPPTATQKPSHKPHIATHKLNPVTSHLPKPINQPKNPNDKPMQQ